MAVKLIYQVFTKLLSWMVLYTCSNTANEIEILVLRHQLAVLQRRTPRPRINWTDRAVIAALARLLPARRRCGLLITPATILRWHRQLVRRRWTHTTPYTRPIGFQNAAVGPDQRFQAAASYSLRSPPRIGRRRIRP